MRRTEVLRQVTIILIAVICLVVAGLRAHEIYKAKKVTEEVEKVTYNGHDYLYFKNIKCIVHDEDCKCPVPKELADTTKNEND